MFKKKSILLGLALSTAFLVSACSSDKASSTDDKASNDAGKVVVTGDTVSEQGGCVLASRFTAGDKIVFRMNATDSADGKQLSSAKLQVHLSTGEVLDMQLGEHPPDDPNAAKFWTAAYPVTADTPTGTLDYYVTAEDGNRKGEYHPFKVAPSMLTIVDPAAAAANGQAQQADTKTENAKAEAPAANVETNQNVDVVATNFKFNKDTFYVKAGQEVTVKLTSKEGTHGLMIEGTDVSINEPNGTAKFTPKKPGEYTMHCSVFCGAGHGQMTAKLVVVE